MKFALFTILSAALAFQLAASEPIEDPTRVQAVEKRSFPSGGFTCYYACPLSWKTYSYFQQASAGVCQYNLGTGVTPHSCTYNTETGMLVDGGDDCLPIRQGSQYCVAKGSPKQGSSEFKRGGIFEGLIIPADGTQGRALTNREKIIKARQWNPKAPRKPSAKRGFNKSPRK